MLLFSGGVRSQLTERGVPPEVRGVPNGTPEDDVSAEDDLAAIEVAAASEAEVEEVEVEEEALELFCSSP